MSCYFKGGGAPVSPDDTWGLGKESKIGKKCHVLFEWPQKHIILENKFMGMTRKNNCCPKLKLRTSIEVIHKR